MLTHRNASMEPWHCFLIFHEAGQGKGFCCFRQVTFCIWLLLKGFSFAVLSGVCLAQRNHSPWWDTEMNTERQRPSDGADREPPAAPFQAEAQPQAVLPLPPAHGVLSCLQTDTRRRGSHPKQLPGSSWAEHRESTPHVSSYMTYGFTDMSQ